MDTDDAKVINGGCRPRSQGGIWHRGTVQGYGRWYLGRNPLHVVAVATLLTGGRLGVTTHYKMQCVK